MSTLIVNISIIIFAYLYSSISNAILICKLVNLPDPRYHGSKNPGATNVLRISNKTAALAVLICDILKGMIPLWLAYYLNVPHLYLGIIAIASCLGHIYPIFFNFKGGKGVATAFGSILIIDWLGWLSILTVSTWIFTIILSGYSSLGAIITAILMPFYVWLFKPNLIFPMGIISCLILFCHRRNIQRLYYGQENCIWQKNKSKKLIKNYLKTLLLLRRRKQE